MSITLKELAEREAVAKSTVMVWVTKLFPDERKVFKGRSRVLTDEQAKEVSEKLTHTKYRLGTGDYTDLYRQMVEEDGMTLTDIRKILKVQSIDTIFKSLDEGIYKDKKVLIYLDDDLPKQRLKILDSEDYR